MNRQILILSSPEDAHARDVAIHLEKFAASVQFFKYDQFIVDYGFDFRVSSANCAARLKSAESGAVIDLPSVDSIWHRRPGLFKAPSFIEPWIAQLVEAEMRTALTSMFGALDCRWVNRIEADTRCMQKIQQLRVAQRLGLQVPKTIITNDKSYVLQFYEELKGKVIYKLLSETSQRFIPSFETPPGIATMPLRASDIEFLDQVKLAPHLFQEHIEKKFDVRVTVIGKKVFATLIHSQSGAGSVDWRNDYSVEMEAFELPAEIEQKCQAVVREYGLNYGAIDLCITNKGEFVFFEVNCAGQYLWAEERTKQPMSLELAKLLAHEAEVLSCN